MKRVITTAIALALTLSVAAPALAQAPGGPGMHHRQAMGGFAGPGGPHGRGGAAFERHLFPPELVLRNQIAIGLSDEQVEQIKKALSQTHAMVIEIQVDLQRATEELSNLLESSAVDEADAMAAAQEVMGLEMRMKNAHLTLLIRVKNLLTAEQQEQLAELRPEGPPRRRSRRP